MSERRRAACNVSVMACRPAQAVDASAGGDAQKDLNIIIAHLYLEELVAKLCISESITG